MRPLTPEELAKIKDIIKAHKYGPHNWPEDEWIEVSPTLDINLHHADNNNYLTAYPVVNGCTNSSKPFPIDPWWSYSFRPADEDYTDIDHLENAIRDSLGLWWTYHPALSKVKLNEDDNENGGYYVYSFRQAVEELLSGGYLHEDVAKSYLGE